MRPVSLAGGLFVLPDIALGALAPEDEPESVPRVPAAVMPGRTTAPAPAADAALNRSRREKSGMVRILSIGLRQCASRLREEPRARLPAETEQARSRDGRAAGLALYGVN